MLHQKRDFDRCHRVMSRGYEVLHQECKLVNIEGILLLLLPLLLLLHYYYYYYYYYYYHCIVLTKTATNAVVMVIPPSTPRATSHLIFSLLP